MSTHNCTTTLSQLSVLINCPRCLISSIRYNNTLWQDALSDAYLVLSQEQDSAHPGPLYLAKLQEMIAQSKTFGEVANAFVKTQLHGREALGELCGGLNEELVEEGDKKVEVEEAVEKRKRQWKISMLGKFRARMENRKRMV